MSLLSVVFRMLDKAGTGFVEPRREDGHGSSAENLSHMQPHNTADDPLHVSATIVTNPIKVEGAHMISVGNSTTTPLGANGTFTGAWEEVDTYVSIMVLVNSDHLASSDSIRIDFSTDGVNLDRSVAVTFQTGGDYCSFPSEAKFFRLRIFNGNQAQTFLRAQVRYNAVAESNKLVPLADSVTQSSAALLTKSSIVGRSSSGGGTFVDVKVNPSGSLQTEVTGTVAISGTVNVAEPISVENTAETPLYVVDSQMHGTWGYVSGIDGTPTIPANAHILQIAVVSPSATASTLTINGGSTITVPAAQSLTIEPKGMLVTPTLVFTGTASYFVEYAVH